MIAFDNLDRVGGEKAIEIMSTIKTFLDPVDEEVENVDVVFIIPCDESAIKRHLRNTMDMHDSPKRLEKPRRSSEMENI